LKIVIFYWKNLFPDLLSKKYYSEVQNIINYGDTKKETTIRNAFYNLLNEYASQNGLILVTELTIKSHYGNNISPDGTLKDQLRLELGLLGECKDAGMWKQKRKGLICTAARLFHMQSEVSK
jgi:hypothetical protein